MVVVRESPKATLSPSKPLANWPPKSPYEALLSSPSGRKKYEAHITRHNGSRSPSPSPLRKPLSSSKALQALSMPSDSDDDDEDEETLQLKLQAIEAKLKLKKLRQSKKKETRTATSGGISAEDVEAPAESVRSRSNRSTEVARVRIEEPVTGFLEPHGVQVPLSPIKNRREAKTSSSPRKLLGIQRDLRAQEVSLKRARNGNSVSTSSTRGHSQRTGDARPSNAPPKSFSERIAESRLSEQDRAAKEERIMQARGTGFGILPAKNNSFDEATRKGSVFSNGHVAPSSKRRKLDIEQQMPTVSEDRAVKLTRSCTVPQDKVPNECSANYSKPPQANRSSKISHQSDRPTAKLLVSTKTESRNSSASSNRPNQKNVEDTFEPYSAFHLSRRLITHTDVTHALEGKELYTLPRLLKEVKAPHYDPPDCETDFVVLATIASKSSPYAHKPSHKSTGDEPELNDETAPRNKFMVLKLTDLKWEVDCFLFDTAFDAFWKLTPGTVLAILNPSVMPPKSNMYSGQFSIKLASSEDTVLEIGSARDLAFCKSIKKNGQECATWIDGRKTEFCDFHVDLTIQKARAGRMEVNGMARGFGGGLKSRTGRASTVLERENRDGANVARQGRWRHPEAGQIYIAPSQYTGRSAATLLDEEDSAGPEALRKRLAEKEKEKILAIKLGQIGNGMGSEYLRLKHADALPTSGSTSTAAGSRSSNNANDHFATKPDAQALGLLNNKASDIHLSPARKKRAFGAAATSSAGPEAMGWGGANKRGLLERNAKALSPEKGQAKLGFQKDSSPWKRARFQLEKGIRVPGRESGVGAGAVPEDDDDDLEFV
ncbi:hypothetical protein LTR66_002311 [Elasticomyces elasticus]|nr:hypothetical protein LTR66_002311 [Elasticomyces elasticus]